MKTFAHKLLSLLILTTTLAACNFPGATGVPATSEPSEEPAATEESASLPPADFTAILDEKVASGEWTQEQGLVTLLQVFAGEVTAAEAGVDPSTLLEAEGNGILSLAAEYLDTGTDDATKAEITRLLAVLFPLQEQLNLYSAPIGQASGRSPGRALPVSPQEENCASLWRAGFPDPRTPGFRCFFFDEANSAGQNLRVYFPVAWKDDATRMPYFRYALDAASDAVAVYQGYGLVRPIYFVFNTLEEATNPVNVLATAYWDHFVVGEACPVVIYPSALTLSEAYFKQTIAHEVFHCFESWNLRSQGIGAGYTSSKWWVEGAAEYFSNLVYPTTNYEYRFANSFSTRSQSAPLMEMTYENFVFFQFIANKSGPGGVIDLLSQMPIQPGRDLQTAALAAVGGMDATFEEFARSILDQTLMDTSGILANIPPSFTREYLFNSLGFITLSAKPFVFARYKVTFQQEQEFTLTATSSGTGHSAVRLRGAPGVWDVFPATINGGCAGTPYIAYVVTTIPSQERIDTVTATAIAEKACDRCLIGSWTATPESLVAYFRSVQNANPANTPVKIGSDVGGSMSVNYLETGMAETSFDNLTIHASISEPFQDTSGGTSYMLTKLDMIFNGGVAGPYTVSANTITGAGGVSTLTAKADTFVNGAWMGLVDIPIDQATAISGGGLPMFYECSGDTLTTWPPVSGIEVSPIIYTRNP